MDARRHTAERSVRDHLTATGVVGVSRRRWLGVVPYRHVVPSDLDLVHALRERVRAVLPEGDPATAPLEDTVLAAIAVDGGARTVFTGRELRRHRTGVRALGARVDEVLPGLRNALSWTIAARRTAASA